MNPAEMDVPTALRLLSLPRVVGVDPQTREEITAQNGRYGPYIKRGTESRSLASEDELFTVDLDRSLELLAAPKYGPGRGRAAARPPLAEFGPDPESGKPMVVKDGRFGMYLTDGQTNVTLKHGFEDLTPADAARMLAEKRAMGPAKKKTTKKTTKKK